MNISINTMVSHSPIPPTQQPVSAVQKQLGDGAEELSFGATATRQPRRRSIGKFNARPRQAKINQVLNLLASQEGGAAMGGRFNRLQRLSKSARSAGDDIDSFMDVNELGPEDRMLLLQQLLNDLDSQGEQATTFYASALAAQQALDEDQGFEIRARMHALEVGLREGMSEAQIGNFQDGYLGMILGSGNCVDALDEILRRFKRQLRRALALLSKVLGDEIDSQWSSCEPGYLQLLRQALYEVGGIANTYDECETLSTRWQEKDALLLDDPTQLTRELVRLAAEPWVVGVKFMTLANKYSKERWRLSFIARLRSVVHGMPYLLFYDEAAQQRTYEAIQQTLDEAADQEPL
ncbi:MAG TPA: TyeA family type III secretion system gatekeeper subunit [Herbaspirillum sp.]|jgi:type III secretion system YopN/LcrE/InvE/MxiC family regulator